MIKLAMCDDEFISRTVYEANLNKVMKEINVKAEVKSYISGEDIIKDVKKNIDLYNIIIINIIIGDNNGIDVARIIRELGYTGVIIFLTSSAEHALNGYEVEALSYILKDEYDKKIKNEIRRAINKLSIETEEYIIAKKENNSIKINIEEIEVLEVNNRNIMIYNNINESIIFKGKISEYEQRLMGSGFIKPHRSYLINKKYIKSISATDITTKSGIIVPLSRIRRKEVQEAFKLKL